MKIERITVSTGRKFNHPYESYSNLSPALGISATLDPPTDDEKIVKVRVQELQALAETLMDEHKAGLLKRLEAEYEAEQAEWRRQRAEAADDDNDVPC